MSRINFMYFVPVLTDEISNFVELNEEMTDYAKHLGFDGVDEDLFYEAYYQLDNDEYEYDYDEVIDMSYDSY